MLAQGKGFPTEATTEQVPGTNRLPALARSCNLRTDCTGFTTSGQLVLSSIGNVAGLPSSGLAPGPCEGLYVRAAVVESGVWGMTQTSGCQACKRKWALQLRAC